MSQHLSFLHRPLGISLLLCGVLLWSDCGRQQPGTPESDVAAANHQDNEPGATAIKPETSGALTVEATVVFSATDEVLPSLSDKDSGKNKKEKGPGHNGRWRKRRTPGPTQQLTEEQQEAIERLEAIGYLSGTEEGSGETGVTRYDRQRACQGLNFFTSGHGPEAILMDMEGKILHQWRRDFRDVWPNYSKKWVRNHSGGQYWRRAYLYENGDILAIFEGQGLVKLDKHSNILWATDCRAHHDLEVMPGGDVYVLTREARMIPRINPDEPILEDFVSILDEQGREKHRVSVLECVENSNEYREFMLERFPKEGDIFHTNSLRVLRGIIADRAEAFQAGRILTSMWHLSCIAVLDLEAETVVWAKRGVFRRQHDPRILPNGNLLLFDNSGLGVHSQVLEYDVPTMDVKWSYQGMEEDPFYSKTNGASRRLANGNTLISETDNGRALEVTPDGEIVWEYTNPHRAGEKDEFIAVIPEMIRLAPDVPVDWLE